MKTKKPHQIFFIHIEKTAGSSILKSLIETNAESCNRIGKIVHALRCDEVVVSGHLPYGFHFFRPNPVRYFTMLRHPVDRCVSWYYFIKDLVRTDLWEAHPLRDYADRHAITTFYNNRRWQNMQTQFVAGYPYNLIYPLLGGNQKFEQLMLQRAKNNLLRFAAFGLQDRFDESVRVFQKVFDWTYYEPVPRQAKTKQRPSLQDIDDLNPEVLPTLRYQNRLDMELYNFATSKFKRQSGI